ncbi:pyruvate kinase [bacterium]|nr:pyruvate kinase [bacterium]
MDRAELPMSATPHSTRLTKIVATLGPASSDPSVIRELIREGVDLFRLNFSHGSHESHTDLIRTIRQACSDTGSDVAILQDLGGPKLRIGDLGDDHIHLAAGHTFRLQAGLSEGDENAVGIEDEGWFDEVDRGDRVVLGDGKIVLRVNEKDTEGFTCEVLTGGTLRGRAGLNFPDSDLTLGALTAKDWKDLEFGLEQKVDFVALSFVQGPDDLIAVRSFMSHNSRKPRLIAKIERPRAVERIDSILEVTDGIMVARGDLGISVPIEQVPTIQKRLIRKARDTMKLVITATQMLESMTDAPLPTRAEVTDVANAVHDGTDAVMLSGETAVGVDPVHVVRTMVGILREAERYARFDIAPALDDSIEGALAVTIRELAEEVGARMIFAPITSGSTAARISRQRGRVAILAGVTSAEDARRLRPLHGVYPLEIPYSESMYESSRHVIEFAVSKGWIHEGERSLIAGGFPVQRAGVTNFLRVVTIGEEL